MGAGTAIRGIAAARGAAVAARRTRTAAAGLAVAAALAAVTAVAAAPAAAHRAPTHDELEQMAGATGPPSDPACVRGRISTVDVRWGALFATDAGDCPRIERIWVLEREAPGTPGGRWRELRQGIRFGVCSRDLPGIPDRVGVDLGVCAPPSRAVYAPSGDRRASRPRRLRYSRNATIERIVWSSWGGRTASGRGTFSYRDPYGGDFTAAVTVTLSGIDLCGSDRVYLKARLTGVTAADSAKVRAYSAPWLRQCPGVTAN